MLRVVKPMTLRRDGHCATCEVPTPAGTKAWWCKSQRCVFCEVCAAALTDCPPAPIPQGVAGGSAQLEYEKRHARQIEKVESRWGTGKMGQLAKVVIDEPQHVTAWKKGAEGERRLSALLRSELGEVAVVLDDLSVPGTKANIDHIVVGGQRRVGRRCQELQRQG